MFSLFAHLFVVNQRKWVAAPIAAQSLDRLLPLEQMEECDRHLNRQARQVNLHSTLLFARDDNWTFRDKLRKADCGESTHCRRRRFQSIGPFGETRDFLTWLRDILSDYLEHSSLSLDCCAKASRGKVKSKRISSTDDVIASESLEKKEISVLRKLGFGKPFLLLSPCYVLVPPCCILTILRWGKQKTLPLKKKKIGRFDLASACQLFGRCV